VVDQTVIDDDRLSLAGRGLLLTLLSKPDDWQVRVSDLRRRCRVGRDYVYKLLGELKDLGYIRYEFNRTASGRMAGGTYYVHEIPTEIRSIEPLPDSPEAAAPNPPTTDAIPNTQRDSITTTTVVESGGESELAKNLVFPDGLLDTERALAERLVAELGIALRRPVLDELAGLMKADKVREVPLACLRGIVAKAKTGAFTPDRALRVAQARRERRRSEEALERARARRPDFSHKLDTESR
jgi:hypothetical protein